ncbi:MAG: homoserine kinase [Pseudomonadota bacterium]
MAVYTEVADNALRVFLSDFDIGDLTDKTPIAEGVENSNYRIDTTNGSFILTLFEKRVREEDLPFFMALTGYLAKQGLPVAAPIADRNGGIIKRLAERPATIVQFLNGRPHMAPSPSDCGKLGAVLAALHEKARRFTPERDNPLSLDGWRRLAGACRSEADRCAAGLAAAIDDECRFLSASWPSALPRGVIHSDLFPDNVLFDGDEISGVIDFYFSCTDFFAYDLAVCINAWCFDEEGTFQSENAANLVADYTAGRSLNNEERAALPILLRGSALRFLLTRLYDWLNQVEGALVTVKDPLPFSRILAFHQNQSKPSLYGL